MGHRYSFPLRQIAYLLLFFTATAGAQAPLSPGLPAGTKPVRKVVDATSGQDRRFAEAFQETRNWVGKAFPGAVLAVGQHGRLLAWKAFGRIDSAPNAPPMPRKAIFDLASLTKVIGTTTAVEILYDRHQLDLDAPVTKYIPEFAGTPGHDEILVRNLLTHSSGLNSKEVLWKEANDRAGIMKLLYTLPVEWEPGTRTQYRDYNFMLLGEIVQRITGERLDQFLKREVFKPLGMKHTGYNPRPKFLARIPPTEQDNVLRHTLVHGVVHDEKAYLMGGVSGHAGLFSSAHDLSTFAQMYLNGGTYKGKRIVSRQTIELFMQRQSTPQETTRALGWDTPGGMEFSGQIAPPGATIQTGLTGASIPPGTTGGVGSDKLGLMELFSGGLASPRAIVHTGFTGTSIYIDPARDAFIILLTNRVNPSRQNLLINEARPAIHTAILRTLDAAQAEAAHSGATGPELHSSMAADAVPDRVPPYEVLRTAEPIHVDGKLDEPEWSAAPTIGPLVNNADGSPSSIRTEAKILYDNTFIYFAFRNSDPAIRATMTTRDQPLWQEEVDEVFVQPDSRQPAYIELEINPLGAIFDAHFSDVRKPADAANWNSRSLQWAAHIEKTGEPGGEGWTSEIALPLADAVPALHTPPQAGDKWRVNLYRIERVPVQARLAWSPTHRDFHFPAAFGEIVFSNGVVGQ